MLDIGSLQWGDPIVEDYVWDFTHRKSYLCGPFGTGKTLASMKHLLLFPVMRSKPRQYLDFGERYVAEGIIVKESETSFEDSLQDTMKEFFVPLGATFRDGGKNMFMDYTIVVNNEPRKCVLKYTVLGLDEDKRYEKVRGVTRDFLYYNEVINLRDRTAVIGKLDTRLWRDNVLRGDSQVFGDFNPPPSTPTHWIWKQIPIPTLEKMRSAGEQAKDEGWRGYIDEYEHLKDMNVGRYIPSQLNVKTLCNLHADPTMYKALQFEHEDDQAFVDENLHGIPGTYGTEERIHKPFRADVHVKRFEPDPLRVIFIGADQGWYGGVVMAQLTDDRQIVVFDEFKNPNMNATDLAKAIIGRLSARFAGFKVEAGWCDPAGNARSTTDGQTFIQVFEQTCAESGYAFPFYPAPFEGGSNNWDERQEVVNRLLKETVDATNKQPMLMIAEHCKELINDILKYRWKPIKTAETGEIRYERKKQPGPETALPEALQYLCQGLSIDYLSGNANRVDYEAYNRAHPPKSPGWGPKEDNDPTKKWDMRKEGDDYVLRPRLPAQTNRGSPARKSLVGRRNR